MANLDDAFIHGNSSIKTLVTAAADGLLVARNPQRIALHILPGSGTIAINNRQLASGTDGGIVSTNAGGYAITQRTHGDAATMEWHGWANAAGTCLIIEVFSCKCATGWGGE